MSRPEGAVGKRSKQFSRLVNRLEREKKISTEAVLRSLFWRAVDRDPEHGAVANAACKQFLDRVIGPTIRSVNLNVEHSGADPLTTLLRQLQAEREARLRGEIVETETVPELPPMTTPDGENQKFPAGNI